MGTSLQFSHCGGEETESCLFGLFFKKDRKRRGGGDEGGRQKKKEAGVGENKGRGRVGETDTICLAFNTVVTFH